MRAVELGRFRFNLLSFSVQNLLILYVLNISCLVQWLKFFFRKFLDLPSNVFFFNKVDNLYSNLVNELCSLFVKFLNFQYPSVALPFSRLSINFFFVSDFFN